MCCFLFVCLSFLFHLLRTSRNLRHHTLIAIFFGHDVPKGRTGAFHGFCRSGAHLVRLAGVEGRHGAVGDAARGRTTSGRRGVGILPVVQQVDEVERAVDDKARVRLDAVCPVLVVVNFVTVKGEGREAKEGDRGPAERADQRGTRGVCVIGDGTRARYNVQVRSDLLIP